VCSLEPGGEYEETIVEVDVDGAPRYFATETGARMTEVPERYVIVRRMSEIRSMHELDADEMAQLEDELGFERPVAGHDPLDDPAWTELLDERDRVAGSTGPVTPLRATGPVTPLPPAPTEPDERIDLGVALAAEAAEAPDAPEAPAAPDAADEPEEPDAAEDLPETTEPAGADRPARSTKDVDMTMESDADWTFEQFEAVVAGSAPAPTPLRAVPPGPVAPVAAAPTAAAPAQAAPAPATPAPAPATPAPAAAAPAPAAPAPTAPAASARPSAPAASAAALQIGLAQGIAFVAHRGQTDQLGAEYIDHPGRVAETFDPISQPVEVAVAWLHDVLEDTDLTAQRLREAGVAPEVIDAVLLLTRTPDVAEAEYYARIRTNAVARSVKLADIADNTAPWRLRKLDHETQARLAEKYGKARAALA